MNPGLLRWMSWLPRIQNNIAKHVRLVKNLWILKAELQNLSNYFQNGIKKEKSVSLQFSWGSSTGMVNSQNWLCFQRKCSRPGSEVCLTRKVWGEVGWGQTNPSLRQGPCLVHTEQSVQRSCSGQVSATGIRGKTKVGSQGPVAVRLPS